MFTKNDLQVLDDSIGSGMCFFNNVGRYYTEIFDAKIT